MNASLKPKVTQSRLMEVLDYDAQTGVFTWKVKVKKMNPGSVAGCVNWHGYEQISIASKSYKAHHLAWLYVYGVWPTGLIDHINGRRNDNRIENLRETDGFGNMQNQGRAHSRSSSGLLGAHRANGGRWKASIAVAGKRFHLGMFETPELAHEAYLSAKREAHATCRI